MVHMLTRHLLHLRTLLKLILTNRTLVQLRAQQLIIHGHSRQLLNGVLRRRRRPVTVRIILGELLDQLLQPGAKKVIAEVGREAKPGFARVVNLELNVGSVGAKALEVVLEKENRVEHFRFGSGPGARVLEVDGGGQQEREKGERMEGEIGIGGRVGAEMQCDVRVRVGIIWRQFFDKTFEADRAERLGVIVGAGESPTAHVAEERLNSAAAGRHDSSEKEKRLRITITGLVLEQLK